MTMYDKLWVCPVCESSHNKDEWNEATEKDFGVPILGIEQSKESPESTYTCPLCNNVSTYNSLRVVSH